MDTTKIRIALDADALCPTRAHSLDAGLDLYTNTSHAIPPRNSITVDTGVHVEIPAGYVGMVKSRSGLNIKSGITTTGVIDAGYTGSIRVKLYNNSFDTVVIKPFDRIAQLVILPIITPTVEIVDKLDDDTERGSAGFGSTGN